VDFCGFLFFEYIVLNWSLSFLRGGGLLYLRGGSEGRAKVRCRYLYSIFKRRRGLLYFSRCFFSRKFEKKVQNILVLHK
jgi:hypothetical protein